MDPFEDSLSDQPQTKTDEQLIHLFRTCDRRDKGYIVREELEELCITLGISSDDSDTLFYDLDLDRDGRISFEDFSTGFKEFLNPEKEDKTLQGTFRRRTSMWSIPAELNLMQDKELIIMERNDELKSGDSAFQEEFERRQKENVYQAWTSFTSSLVESKLLSLSSESQSQIRQLYKELQRRSVPLSVATKVESAVSSLMKEMEQLQKQNKDLEKLYEKEKLTHVKTLQSLEEEIEDQVAKVEEKAKASAKLEQELEKKQLQEQMAEEVAEMQAHLKIFQKVDSWLSEHGTEKDQVHEVRKKLEESFNTNKELQTSLHSTMANLALLRSDLAHSRLQYEEKCKELHQEREHVLEYMHQYDHLRRQLDLIHTANKRLQDVNDGLRENFEAELRNPSLSRTSSCQSSTKKIRRLSHPVSCSEKEAEKNAQFGIRRLLEGSDSGLSTLSGKLDEVHGGIKPMNHHYDNGPPSLEEELKNTLFVNSSGDRPSEMSSYGTPVHGDTSKSGSLSSNSSFKTSTSISAIPKYRSSTSMTTIRERPPDRTYKLVMAGDASVGKTTFIARLCQGVFVNNLASTLGVDYKVKSIDVDGKHTVIQLWDTAGQERFRSITKSYFRRADGVLLLYDVTCERSFLDIRSWIQSIEESCEVEIPIILCGNKTDLREDYMRKGISVVCPTAGERLAKEYKATFFETSTKTGENVMDSLMEIARQMVSSEDLAVQTSALRVISNPHNKGGCCVWKPKDKKSI